jgi:hypothetical protein
MLKTLKNAAVAACRWVALVKRCLGLPTVVTAVRILLKHRMRFEKDGQVCYRRLGWNFKKHLDKSTLDDTKRDSPDA